MIPSTRAAPTAAGSAPATRSATTARPHARTGAQPSGETVRQATLLVDGYACRYMDDRDGRAAVKGLQMNVDLMGTRTFIALMDEDYGIKEAATAWVTLAEILRGELDRGERDDPVFVRPKR